MYGSDITVCLTVLKLTFTWSFSISINNYLPILTKIFNFTGEIKHMHYADFCQFQV